MTPVQKINIAAYAAIGFCSVVSPALSPTHPFLACIVGGIGGAALGIKGYLSSSPKDSMETKTEDTKPAVQKP